jgi:UDP-N-acetylglucosamine:LPS N-acetylglucosamine transferase
MERDGTILILTARTGGGHISLAHALRDQLEGEFATAVEDLLPEFFGKHYGVVGRHANWLWSLQFHATNGRQRAKLLHSGLIPVVAPKLKLMMEKYHPDVLITTHPLLSSNVASALQRQGYTAPLVSLFSDPWRVHASWLTDSRPAAALAPTEEIYTQALRAGIPTNHLHRVLWPLRRQFYREDLPSPAAMREKINQTQGWSLDPRRFTVFLQGGGDGATKLKLVAQSILGVGDDVQIILAAGANADLMTAFAEEKNVFALPFTPDIADYMIAADISVGKAGPNSLFESVALNRPFVATSYLPGQEEGNLELIRIHKLGAIALKRTELQELISTLIAEHRSGGALLHSMTQDLNKYRDEMRAASKPIAPIIRHLLPSVVARNASG